MTERKRRAQTILVGCQGHPVTDNMHSVAPLLHMNTMRALQQHAPTLEQTMRVAGCIEGSYLVHGTSDEAVAEELVLQKTNLSRMQLECLGFLP